MDHGQSDFLSPGDIWAGWPLLEIPEKPAKGGETARAFNRRKARNEDFKATLEIIYHSQPGLVIGEPNITLTKDEVSSLFAQIHQNCNGYQLRRRHNFLRQGLIHGANQLDWNIPIPDPMVVLPREPSPFTPNSFSPLSSLHRLHQRFLDTLHDPDFFLAPKNYIKKSAQAGFAKKQYQPTAEQLLLGKIIFSAVVNGALLHRKWVVSLIRDLPNSLVARDNRLFLDLHHVEKQGDMAVTLTRRWFPDSTTSCLLLFWHSIYRGQSEFDQSESPDKILQHCLPRYLACLGLSPDDRPSFAQLAAVAGTNLRLKIPPFLVTYAESLTIALSLEETGWARLQTDRITKKMVVHSARLERSDKGKFEVAADASTPQIHDEYDELPDQHKKLQDLFRPFTRSKKASPSFKRNLLADLKKLTKDPAASSLVKALAEWAIRLVTVRTGKKILGPTSAVQYLYAISKPLVIHWTGIPFKDMSSSDWETLYDQVLETSVSPNNRSNRAERLSDFHDFLVKKHGVAPADISDVAGGLRMVDANIITPREYIVLGRHLMNNPFQPERIRIMHTVLLILCYRLGLRRAEARRIRLVDLTPITIFETITLPISPSALPAVELHIRSNPFGKVKSSKSTRRLPLNLLLTPEEISYLVQWVKIRKSEVRENVPKNCLLFCEEGQNDTLINDRLLFSPIQNAMREITRDPTISMHNLRHSFATYMLIYLFSGKIPGLIPEIWRNKDSKKLLPEDLPSLPRQLLLSENIQASRRLLYLISTLCGHVDPKETQNTYMHLFDWLLGAYLQQDQHKLPLPTQAALLGITHASWRAERSRKDLTGLHSTKDFIAFFVDRIGSKGILPDPVLEGMEPLASSMKNTDPESGAVQDPFIVLQIFEGFRQGATIHALADHFRFPADTIQEWIDRARELGGRRTKRNRLALINKQQNNIAGPENKFWPSMPSTRNDCADAAMIFSCVARLTNEEDKGIVRQGLGLYLSKTTRTDSRLKLATSEEKLIFLKLLRLIGFEKERIVISLFPNPDISEHYQMQYWSKQFDVPIDIFQIENTDKRPIEEMGRTVVWPRGRPYKSKKKTEKIFTPEKHPAQGLRFGLFFAEVVFGFLSTDPKKAG
ncbi:MAG: site-specific integrase [Thermodesulfobacteriota bacterium]